jgi:hypothetical protein
MLSILKFDQVMLLAWIATRNVVIQPLFPRQEPPTPRTHQSLTTDPALETSAVERVDHGDVVKGDAATPSCISDPLKHDECNPEMKKATHLSTRAYNPWF